MCPECLHFTPGAIALYITESGDGGIVHLVSADVEPHDPAGVQRPHQLQVIHNASEVPGAQLAPETEGDNILIGSPRHASPATEILRQGFLVRILKAVYLEFVT